MDLWVRLDVEGNTELNAFPGTLSDQLTGRAKGGSGLYGPILALYSLTGGWEVGSLVVGIGVSEVGIVEARWRNPAVWARVAG